MRPLGEPAAAPHVLVARLDGPEQVLLTGPAIRAVAAGAGRVTLLCGPEGEGAARLLPGVAQVLVHRAAWAHADAPPLDWYATMELVGQLGSLGLDQAILLAALGDSCLPTALLLRLAGVPVVAGYSLEQAGSLLDVCPEDPQDEHEVRRNLALAAALGYVPPDDDRLRLLVASDDRPARAVDVLVVASQPEAGSALEAQGWRVAVTDPQVPPRELAVAVSAARTVVTDSGFAAQVAASAGLPVVMLDEPAPGLEPWRTPHRVCGDPAGLPAAVGDLLSAVASLR